MAKSNCFRALSELSVYWDQQTDEKGKVSTWAHIVLTSREYAKFGEKQVPLPGSDWHYSQWLHGEDAKEMSNFAIANGEPMQGLENAVKLYVSNKEHRKALEEQYPQILCLYACFGMKQKREVFVFDCPHIRVDKNGNVVSKKPTLTAKYVYFVGGDASNKGSEYGKEAALARLSEEYKPAELAGAEDDQDDAEMRQDDGE